MGGRTTRLEPGTTKGEAIKLEYEAPPDEWGGGRGKQGDQNQKTGAGEDEDKKENREKRTAHPKRIGGSPLVLFEKQVRTGKSGGVSDCGRARAGHRKRHKGKKTLTDKTKCDSRQEKKHETERFDHARMMIQSRMGGTKRLGG